MAGETTRPSINDMTTTGNAGSLLGEALFRMSQLVLQDKRPRTGAVRELSAALISPPTAVNRYLFGELGFTGNREQFEDPRNSCLNEVMDKKKGIPITMALIYIEVARRAGIRSEGVNFPGHFLVRCLQDLHTDDPGEGLIVDPFHGGAILNEAECRKLLEPHMEDQAYSPSLLARATRRQILARMLLNLKRLYVKMHSFPQARATTDALLALQPSSLADLRDRGLLAYHMNDFSHALRDLEAYLKVARLSEQDDDQKKETEQVWEHVKTLRRRVAQLN
jgi:regulator of sirC expression with transglutaminase-like and TPR domain